MRKTKMLAALLAGLITLSLAGCGADKAENIYVVCKAVNTGSVQFNRDGEFQGFYGANRVEVTAAVVAQKL